MALLKLISDWRARASDPPAHWTVGLIPACCREEINDCAKELEEELSAATAEWKCFHCGMIIRDEHHAREHFGPIAGSGTFCAERAILSEELERTKANLAVTTAENVRLRDELANLDTTARELLNNARLKMRAGEPPQET